MAERSEPSVFSKAALAVLVAGSLFAPMLPVEASINSQVKMELAPANLFQPASFCLFHRGHSPCSARVFTWEGDTDCLCFGGGLQMSMNTDSFSVLRDNQKTYAQKGRTVNPYASQEEQLQQVVTFSSATSVSRAFASWLLRGHSRMLESIP